jgi:UDP-N-acetylmuramate dehydrogenase
MKRSLGSGRMMALTDGPVERAEGILRETAEDRVRRDFPLAPLTTFRIGGPAALYLQAESPDDLSAAGKVFREVGLPVLVIGKGSNVLVSDEGFSGLVLRLGRAFRWAARDGMRLSAGGSMPLPALAGIALRHGLTGLEFGVAIPASLGGAVRMNAGAHGSSVADVLERVDVFRLDSGRFEALPADEGGFGYRVSAFPQGSVVVGATARLELGEDDVIRGRMEEARVWRRRTQPLSEANCGSVFKNPPGEHAARLIEAAGAKELRVGRARVSEKHANFIVAEPGARARDVRELIELVRGRVRERHDLELELELHVVGDGHP